MVIRLLRAKLWSAPCCRTKIPDRLSALAHNDLSSTLAQPKHSSVQVYLNPNLPKPKASQNQDYPNPRLSKPETLALVGCGNLLDLVGKGKPLDGVADVATIKDVGDIRQRHDHEAAGMCLQRKLDALLHLLEPVRVFLSNAMRVAHRDADLADTAQPFLDQCLMAIVKGLIAPHEQRGRALRVEGRAQQCNGLFSPV